jgi:UDP-galactose transporter B1
MRNFWNSHSCAITLCVLFSPRICSFMIAVAGIFGGFSYMAVKQEDVYKTAFGKTEGKNANPGEKFAFTFFALAAERGINALIALAGVLVFGGSGNKIPKMEIFNSGVSQMLAMAASGEALRYVSYATQVLGKSCKMVPVMVGGLVLGGKSYKPSEYAQVLLVTIGVVVFNFGGKSKKGADDSSYGLLLISASLLMDMVTGGLQDKVKASTKKLNNNDKAKTSAFESMLWTNISGCLVALALGAFTGHVDGGLAFCNKYPEALTAITVYSLASAVGQVFIYYTVTEFGPLLLTTVTTTRKIFSTLYSVFRNPRSCLWGAAAGCLTMMDLLTAMQWGGCGLVFLGIFIEVAEKFMGSSKPTAPAGDAKKRTPKAQ